MKDHLIIQAFHIIPPPGAFDVCHSFQVGVTSGLCRCAANLAFFPFDTITTRKEALQRPLCPSWRVIDQCQACDPMDSTKNLFAGVTGMMIGTFPSVLGLSLVHDYVSAVVGKEPLLIEGLEWPVAVIITILPLSLITTPTEVLKQRVQVGYQPNVFRAARAIFACHGVAGFYWAYWALVFRDLLFTLVQSSTASLLVLLASEEEAIISQLPSLPDKLDGWVSESIFVGATAFATICTQPLDVQKTRLATNSGIRTIFEPFVGVFEKDRKLGNLYLGLGPRVAALCLSTAVFAVFDAFVIHKIV